MRLVAVLRYKYYQEWLGNKQTPLRINDTPTAPYLLAKQNEYTVKDALFNVRNTEIIINPTVEQIQAINKDDSDYAKIIAFPDQISMGFLWKIGEKKIKELDLIELVTNEDGSPKLDGQGCVIRLIDEETKVSTNIRQRSYSYEDMVAIYNLGRDEKSKSQASGAYIDTHKEFMERL